MVNGDKSGINTYLCIMFIRYLQMNRHTLDYPRQLFGYAQNIADGMEYLTQVLEFGTFILWQFLSEVRYLFPLRIRILGQLNPIKFFI